MTCFCDLPDGTPHDCSKERQGDEAISFISLAEFADREFYPGWADAAGKRAGDAERHELREARTVMRANVYRLGVDYEGKRRRSSADSRFVLGQLALDVALRETSK